MALFKTGGSVVLTTIAVFCALPALASPERLAADLRTNWGEVGEVSIGSVEAIGENQVRANDIRVVMDDGETWHIDQYDVEGDYDSPERVVIHGFTWDEIEIETDELYQASMRQFVGETIMENPPHAVQNNTQPFDVPRLVMRNTSLVISIEDPGSSEPGTELLLDVAESDYHDISTVGLTMDNMVSAENMEISGVALYASEASWQVRIDELQSKGYRHDFSNPDDFQLDMPVDIKDLVFVLGEKELGRVASVVVDATRDNGNTQLSLEGMKIDMAALIATTGATEVSTLLRMFNNAVNGGRDQLAMSFSLGESWQDKGSYTQVLVTMATEIVDSVALSVSTDYSLTMAAGTSLADYGLLDLLELQAPPEMNFYPEAGGALSMELEDRGGLKGIIILVSAAMWEMSHDQLAQQLQQQAVALGITEETPLGEFVDGLVQVVEGSATELGLDIMLARGSTLEEGSNLVQLLNDPSQTSVATSLK